MRSASINHKKKSVLEYIASLEDGAELDKFLRIITSTIHENEVLGLTDEHLAIINQRRELHLSGASKSFTFDEVIENARNSRLK